MTPLQILRATVTDGATLTLSKRADGYYIEVTATDGAGQMVRRAVVHPRLEQALFLVVAGETGEGVAGRTRFSSAERPQTTVDLPGYWIMRTEVTNAQYQQCVAAQACTPPANALWDDPAAADRPVVNVSWRQAGDYAAWAGGRLPTEAEWEKACRGADGRVYPWGEATPSPTEASFGSQVDAALPVGSYPAGASPYGALDMAGNVWEWTSSQYQPYPYQADDGRESPDGNDDRVLRGGSFSMGRVKLRCDVRLKFDPNDSNSGFGFRVVSAGG